MKNILFLLISLILTASVVAQKIKYKEIIPLLETKNYKHAERKLKAFLDDSKNADHPSANLYMAIIWQEKIKHIDPIKEPQKFDEVNATAISYFRKAGGLITEKDIDKHEEYYADYNRRDLRTGKYGVKLSDVTLDIDERINALERAKTDLAMLVDQLEKARKLYEKQEFLFLSMRKIASTDRSLQMRLAANSDDLDKLYELITIQPSVVDELNGAKISAEKLPNKPFDVEPQWQTIHSFTDEGEATANFMEGDFVLWDHAKWAERMISAVTEQVRPQLAEAIKYDTKLTKELERVQSSTYLEFEGLTSDLSEAPVEAMEKLREEPYPLALFDLKIKELPVHFYLNTQINPSALDTADVDYQLWYTDTLLSVINHYNEHIEAFINKRFSYDDWSFFLSEQYGSKEAYQSYLRERKDWSNALLKAWNERQEAWQNRSLYAIQEGDKSIPMYSVTNMRVDSAYHFKYLTMDTMKDTLTGNYYVIGVELKDGDKKEGFLASVSNARTMLWKKNFSMGKVIFGGVDIVAAGQFIETEEDMLAFYLYTPSQGVLQNTLFVKTDAKGKIIWKTAYAAQSKPENFEFHPADKSTSVYFGEKTDPSTYVFTISGSGKVIKK